MKLKSKKSQPRRRSAKASSDMKVNKFVSKRKSDSTPNKRKSTKRKRALIRVSVVAVIVLAITLILWNNAWINETVVSGDADDKYIQEVEDYLNRNPFANLKSLISYQAIEDNLKASYPEVESADISMPVFGDSLEVSITERQALLALKDGDDYYLIDQSGYAYNTYDPEDGAKSNVVILSDDSNVGYDINLGDQVLPSSLINFVQNVNLALTESGSYQDQSFSYLLTNEARVIYIRPSGVSYRIKMQLDQPVNQQIDTFIKGLEYLNNRGTTPVEYIDVRINGTIYYK